jgi:(p)ppGpp synthase/HD superfamily hydrolase
MERNSERLKKQLASAIALAAIAHQRQVDKAGQPYILHPIHVMGQMQNDADRICAILHDVMEDTDKTAKDLELLGIDEREINVLQALTRNKGESYKEFIVRLSSYSAAVRVKIADLRHNMDLMRLSAVTSGDLTRLVQYHTALRCLQSVDPIGWAEEIWR